LFGFHLGGDHKKTMPDDASLLRRYAEERTETAFAELVRRHLDGVYSAALRRLGGDRHLAEDVSQQVFAALAGQAETLAAREEVTGWLYTTTRNVAANVVRGERRRKQREQEALNMNEVFAPTENEADWSRVAPVLDAAIDQLAENDRAAILARFIDRRAFGEMGAALRISEDAARMRVERALDRLRALLERRGIASTSAALGIALANHAVAAAPAGLAGTVAAGAILATVTGGAIFFMSTSFLKTGVIAVVVLTSAAGFFYQNQNIRKLQTENAQWQARYSQAGKSSRINVTIAQNGDLGGTEIERLRELVARLKDNPANSWQERVALLREALVQLPELSIPELQLATDEDWLDAAKEKLETGDDFRHALSKLRNLVTQKFAKIAQPALRAYLNVHDGQFPRAAMDIQAHLERVIDPAIWQRYAVVSADTVGNVRVGGNFIITQKRVIDEALDSEVVIGPNGFGSSSYGVSALKSMTAAFFAANPGKQLGDPEQLRPFAITSKQKAIIEVAIKSTKQ
jgi:RNA polymerase sigma factor (sigma-70 family)